MKIKPHSIGSMARLAGITALLMAAPVSRSEETYREFTDLQGRTFKGQVVACDAAAQTVTIRTADGRTAKGSLATFSEKDRQYIRDWNFTNDFMNGLRLSAELQSKAVADVDPPDPNMPREVTDAGYKVVLDNRSATGFGKIAIEYCIFYRQGDRREEKVYYENGTCYGRYSIDAMKPADSIPVRTKTIKLYSQSGYQSAFGRVHPSQGDVLGLWLRAKTVLPSGGEVVREFRTSDDSTWRWVTYSIGVGLNPSDTPSLFTVNER